MHKCIKILWNNNTLFIISNRFFFNAALIFCYHFISKPIHHDTRCVSNVFKNVYKCLQECLYILYLVYMSPIPSVAFVLKKIFLQCYLISFI